VRHEKYLLQFKFYVSGFGTSPFGIEWMRFEKDSPIDPLIQSVPHIAFEVDDLDFELENRNFNIITAPNPLSDGVRVAIIEHNGAPIELVALEKKVGMVAIKKINTPGKNKIRQFR
jgi:hypothetical protein